MVAVMAQTVISMRRSFGDIDAKCVAVILPALWLKPT
jgi:hypothetical protein